MMLCFPEHHTSFSGLNVDLNVAEGAYYLFWVHNSTQYQFVMPSSDTATLKVTSHVHNFSPHPRWFLCSRWGLNLFQISFLHKTWCFSVLPGSTQMAQWEEAIQMCSALKTRLQMASQILDLQPFRVVFKSGMSFKRIINFMLPFNNTGTVALFSFSCVFHMWAFVSFYFM